MKITQKELRNIIREVAGKVGNTDSLYTTAVRSSASAAFETFESAYFDALGPLGLKAAYRKRFIDLISEDPELQRLARASAY